jgi:hypothetical protein
MDNDTEFVWVHLDVVRANQVAVYRGRLAVSDLEAITTGGFTTPFVRLDDVHWVEVTWDERTERRELKVTAFGRDGQWCHCAGPLYLRPDTIATVVPLSPDYGSAYRRGALAMPTKSSRGSGGASGQAG